MNNERAELIRKALHRAFLLGQTYWQQADSEYTSHNKKADDTYSKFKALVDETDALLAADGQAGGEAVAEWHLDSEAAQFLAELITADEDGPTEISLRVGQIKDDDGTVKHGLLVYESEYPEEGASLLVECPPLITLQSHREAIAQYAKRNVVITQMLEREQEALAQHRAALEECVEMLDKMRVRYSDAIYDGAGAEKAEKFECDIAAISTAITHANQVLDRKEGE